MSKINILPAQVYNRIAAGEVVDRPYSVVKELVENAIDAGAGEISVFAEGGGKQLIRVVDNGSGILREDLQAAFLPHATSKIAKADDLERIMTLGFRGEAVASIAAVSKMTITSKVKGENCYRLCSEGGKLGEIEEAAGDDGTDVCVENLFYRTRRRKRTSPISSPALFSAAPIFPFRITSTAKRCCNPSAAERRRRSRTSTARRL